MGKIKKFDIAFTGNSNHAFYAGQAVNGKVLVEITEIMKIRAVKLRFIGEGSVSFSDSKLQKSHTNSHKYFEQVDLIFGSTGNSLKADSVTVLNAGLHEFPFVFNLPGQLPSSFESTLGHVRYSCKASLHRPWKFDFTAKRAFTVVSVVDLNVEPLAFTPGYKHAERSFTFSDRFLFCIKGGLSVMLKIERCAYVSGEEIPINAEVSNFSSVNVKGVEAFLQQNLVFSAKSSSRFCRGETKLGLISHGAVKKGDTQIWDREPLVIPPLPPTKLGGCKLISVDYLLNFVVFVENAANIVLTVAIVIGTIPLRPHIGIEQTVRPTVVPTAPMYEPSPLPSAPPMPDFSSMRTNATVWISFLNFEAPPSYEECVDGAQVNIQDADDNQFTYGEMTYQPLYPTYTIRRPAPPIPA